MKRYLVGIVSIILILSVVNLVHYMVHPNTGSSGEVYLTFFLREAALTFPLGVLAVTFIELCFNLIGVDNLFPIGGIIPGYLIYWIGMVFFGLVQWLIIIPKLVEFFKRYKNRLYERK